jgi:hypothetical protein
MGYLSLFVGAKLRMGDPMSASGKRALQCQFT